MIPDPIILLPHRNPSRGDHCGGAGMKKHTRLTPMAKMPEIHQALSKELVACKRKITAKMMPPGRSVRSQHCEA